MKRVYKITPVSLYDVRGLESWLEDMARRGLFLKKLRPAFSTFERGPAQRVRCRAEPFRKTVRDEEPPQAMLDLYQEFGWELVGETPELLIFSTGDENAPEPHSDPELQGALWKRLYRAKRRGFWFSLLFDLAVAVFSMWMLLQNGTPVLNLITTPVLITLILLPIMLFELTASWANVQSLGLIVKQLEEGVPLNHRSVYPRRRWSEVTILAMAVVLLAGLILVQYVLPFTRSGVRPLNELTAFPMLSLAEVEGENYIPRTFVAGGRDYANFCDVEHYLLCPDRWRVVQSGDIQPDNWVRMEIWWYDLPGWLSPLSAPLARELLDDAMGLKRDIWWTDEAGARVWTVYYYPREDAAFLAAAGNGPDGFQIAVAAAGDKAVLVEYTGSGSLAEHLDEIIGMAACG